MPMVPSILARLRTMPASFISALTLRLRVARDLVRIEVVEGAAEIVALAQDRDPREPRLEAVENELLEQRAVVALRHAPLLVVIGDVERILFGPGTTSKPSG